MSNVRKIPVDLIRADAMAQPRQHISTDVVASYADDMAQGAQFPPLVVFKEGNVFWLADGFHRLSAARGVVPKIECEVHNGGLREAILYSCGANAEHGFRRTNEDKRRATLKLLHDEEWSHWSDSEIARRAKVTHTFVGKIRAEIAGSLETVSSEDLRTFRSKHGTVTKMSAAAIGPRKQPSIGANDTREKGYAEPVRYSRKPEAGWIAPLVWEALRIIEQLPPAKEAAAQFPSRQLETVTVEQLDAAAAWLSEFAQAWRRKVA